MYIAKQPGGIIRRLPVRPKGRGKEKILAPWQPQPQRLEQKEILNDLQLLKTGYGLYLITTFKNGVQHVYPICFRNTESEILDDSLLSLTNERVKTGEFKNPAVLLRYTNPKVRKEAADLMKSMSFTQELDIFKISSTYRRPEFLKISKLFEKGFKLEGEQIHRGDDFNP